MSILPSSPRHTHVENRIDVLQLGRGIAALLVVFYHVSLLFKQKLGSELYWDVSHFGQLGVNFFFVLSGFIILLAHHKDIGKPKKVVKYIQKRLIRIYPIYWVCFAVYICAAALGIGEPDFQWSFAQLFSAFTLVHWVPLDGGLPLHVAWTLFFEIMFYALFISFIINFYLGIAVFAIWLCAMIFGLNADLGSGTMIAQFASIWGVNFILGMLAYVIYRVAPDKLSYVFLAIGIGLLATFISRYNYDGYDAFKAIFYDSTALLACSFSFILLGLVMLERLYKCKVNAVFVFLGNASYSIYLAHSMVVSLGIILIKKMHLEIYLNNLFGFWLVLIAAVVLTCILHVIVERPMFSILRKIAK